LNFNNCPGLLANSSGIARITVLISSRYLKVEAPVGVPHTADGPLQNLGAEEREAILPAKARNALLLIDELIGRRIVAKMGVACTGTLGVLVKAKLRGFITSVKVELEALKRDTNFRFDQELFETVLKNARQAP